MGKHAVKETVSLVVSIITHWFRRGPDSTTLTAAPHCTIVHRERDNCCSCQSSYCRTVHREGDNCYLCQSPYGRTVHREGNNWHSCQGPHCRRVHYKGGNQYLYQSNHYGASTPWRRQFSQFFQEPLIKFDEVLIQIWYQEKGKFIIAAKPPNLTFRNLISCGKSTLQRWQFPQFFHKLPIKFSEVLI